MRMEKLLSGDESTLFSDEVSRNSESSQRRREFVHSAAQLRSSLRAEMKKGPQQIASGPSFLRYSVNGNIHRGAEVSRQVFCLHGHAMRTRAHA
jgi:hypothetical protein